LDPEIFAPPAKSKQMKGIFPAPWVAIPQLILRASRSGDRAALTDVDNKPLNNVPPIIVAAPVAKPCAINALLLKGRE